MPCLFIFLSLKGMLITRYVEMNLWLTDNLAYLHISFYKYEKFVLSFIVGNKKGFENISLWERTSNLRYSNFKTALPLSMISYITLLLRIQV